MEECIETSDKFEFPFEPYGIQLELMKNLYKSLEEKNLAIFESPTGTGKSMSLICGALKWLKDHESSIFDNLKLEIEKINQELNDAESTETSDWFNEHASVTKLKQKKFELQTYFNQIQAKNDKIEKIKEKAQKLLRNCEKNENQLKLKYMNKIKSNPKDVEVDEIASGVKDDDDMLLEEDNGIQDEENSGSEDDEDNEEYTGTKIYFCSRTHSQLSQFIGEIKKSPYKDSIRVVSLASRMNYCINESVKKLKHMALINEKCQDLQKNKKGKTTKTSEAGRTAKKSKTNSGCPYLQTTALENLSIRSLTTVQDIEELVEAGKNEKACPYYAARNSIKDAQVVVVPYNTILHRGTREASGISLKNNIVIIDEAHNLLDTISHIHSCEVKGSQLTHAYSQLQQYKQKYHSKFSAANILFLNQLIFVLNKLLVVIGGKGGSIPTEPNKRPIGAKIYTLPDFIITAEVDNINLYKLLEISKKNKITHKLHGFVENYEPTVVVQKPRGDGIQSFLKSISNKKKAVKENIIEEEKPVVKTDQGNNPLLPVLSFIEALTNRSTDGRVVCSRQATIGKSSLKFLLLNPAAHFSDIVEEARAVIVAGGTMQPISEFRDQLYISAGGGKERISIFSCGHVVDPSNIVPIIVSNGPSNRLLDFSYQNRYSNDLINEFGRILTNVCNVVPAGIVCFFPSYDYERHIFEYLTKHGTIQKLNQKKKIFREPKKSSEVDSVLVEYSKCIEEARKGGTQNGALLFSVVGGKLSEGLNFSDDLGRCVIVVGMPYPNITSPELREKMQFLNTNCGEGSGKVYYENLCMKAVNQSIGRAVRHKNDYASVLLLDHRFARTSTRSDLPGWIQKSLISETKFGSVIGTLAKFFANKKPNCIKQ